MVCSRNGVSIIFIFTTPCHPCQARQLQLWFLPLGQGLGVRQKNPQKIHTKKHVAGPNLRCRVRPRVLFDLEVQPCNVFLLNRWIGSGAIPVKKPFTNGSTLTFAFVSHFAATNLCWVFQSIQKVKDDGQRTPYRRQAHTHTFQLKHLKPSVIFSTTSHYHACRTLAWIGRIGLQCQVLSICGFLLQRDGLIDRYIVKLIPKYFK